MATSKLLVDLHSHVYLHRYAAVLRSRTSAPRILTRQSGLEGKLEERLLILEDEPSGGRPVGAQVLDSL
jgi:aminocarboxymuconate-semialdehyde decarboxylase